MVSSEPIPFAVGDVVRLKKPHPCGGFDWTVVRLGADIGVKCVACGRRVLLPRRELERVQTAQDRRHQPRDDLDGALVAHLRARPERSSPR